MSDEPRWFHYFVQSWSKQTYSRVFPTSLAKLSLSSVDSLSRFCWVEINPSGVSDFDIGDMVTDSEIDWETKNILRNSKTELDNRNNHFSSTGQLEVFISIVI